MIRNRLLDRVTNEIVQLGAGKHGGHNVAEGTLGVGLRQQVGVALRRTQNLRLLDLLSTLGSALLVLLLLVRNGGHQLSEALRVLHQVGSLSDLSSLPVSLLVHAADHSTIETTYSR